MSDLIYACDCGFTWSHGQSGKHQCRDGYQRQIEALKKDNAKLASDNKGLNIFLDAASKSIPEIKAAAVDEYLAQVFEGCPDDSNITIRQGTLLMERKEYANTLSSKGGD